MKVKVSITFFLLGIIIAFPIKAQYNFHIPPQLNTEMPESVKNGLINSANELFNRTNNNLDYDDLLYPENIELSRNYFKYLGDMVRTDTLSKYSNPQILNIYKLTGSETYSITIAYSSISNESSISPSIHGIYTFMAIKDKDKFLFESPLKVRTKSWKTETIDELTFYYPDKLNKERATNFARKNRNIAQKFNLPVKHLDIYVTNNYQEVLFLQGIDYSQTGNGIINLGDIISPKTIFSIMGNEDFSHDVLHMYAYQIRGDKRNGIAEEGLAYTWGDAYYADTDGYIPNQKDLEIKLREYLQTHPQETILNIFINNPSIFEYSDKISSRSVISGIICDEIERTKGVAGIIELLRCGAGGENYFNSINKLLSINRDNFNEKVLPLLFHK